MMENHKDSKAMSLFEEFCDLLMELGDSESEEERKTLTDWMISLSDMKEDLKKLRRAQQ